LNLAPALNHYVSMVNWFHPNRKNRQELAYLMKQRAQKDFGEIGKDLPPQKIIFHEGRFYLMPSQEKLLPFNLAYVGELLMLKHSPWPQLEPQEDLLHRVGKYTLLVWMAHATLTSLLVGDKDFYQIARIYYEAGKLVAGGPQRSLMEYWGEPDYLPRLFHSYEFGEFVEKGVTPHLEVFRSIAQEADKQLDHLLPSFNHLHFALVGESLQQAKA